MIDQAAGAMPRRDWGRKYPPLLVAGLAVVLAIVTLPSALNLPQANPGQVAEYAPVPGNGNNAPAGGNFAGLGLGQGGAAQGGGQSGAGLGATTLPPGQLVPTKYNCVGNPPRQTPDPLSPPCVAFWQGDNGGSTWVGVTRNEIVVVFRFVELQGNCRSGTTQGNACGAPSGFYDIENPTDEQQNFFFRYLHDWEVYFNASYQTYGRHVHFYAINCGDTAGYVQSGACASVDSAHADATNAWNHGYGAVAHPFSAMDYSYLNVDTFSQDMARNNVLEFQLSATFTNADYNGFPGLFWSYPPPTDRVAQAYASYVCTKIIAPGKVSFAGSDIPAGTPRKYGLLLTDDSQAPQTEALQQDTLGDLKQDCGFTPPPDTAYFHYSGGDDSGPKSGWGTTNMAQFQTDHVTTILWPGGSEYEDQRAAHNLSYHPEWVIAGDSITEGNLIGLGEPTDESQDFFAVSPQTLQNAEGHSVEQPCYDAITQADPSIDRQSGDIGYACLFYAAIRQLFTGIQLSGPTLTPKNIDQGFHAIPAKPSTGPTQPSCYYLPGDYTCVKDDVAEFFDPNAQVASSNPTEDQATSKGCWRMWENGARFLPGQWPAGDAKGVGWDPNDICNLYAGGYTAGPRPPGS